MCNSWFFLPCTELFQNLESFVALKNIIQDRLLNTFFFCKIEFCLSGIWHGCSVFFVIAATYSLLFNFIYLCIHLFKMDLCKA